MAHATLSRRSLLQTGLAASCLPWLSACNDLGSLGAGPSGAGGRDTALLLPLTGAVAAIGQNMARAATLASNTTGPAPAIFDTADTAEGAASAAQQAIAKGARLLLGPLRSDQTPAVTAVAGRVPVITFSNDEALAQPGTYVLGLTPAQSVGTMFSYARAQGLTRIAVVVSAGLLGQATIAAARQIAAAGGITLTAVLTRDPAKSGLAAALRPSGGGSQPQAVFLADGGAALAGFAAALAGSGLQILGSVQWGAGNAAADRNLSGAWFAAPPPDLFAPFAERFQATFGEAPGLVAGLGHDAALLAIGLGNARGLNRAGIERRAGFTGVLGPFRFLPDGRCQRDLAVLTLRRGVIDVLAEVSGT